MTLPTSFHDNFESGEAKGLGVYIASDAGTNYAVMDGSCKIEVVYS
ncbi:hypothetical protein JMM81_12370 [Bacillus sp. V3B]|nr:hypothetical protein [Bacillus sp. V3B]MCQ6275751.1 hypothetical protein [Bacillus sp. V3B]